MRRRLASLLLAGLMILNSIPVYAEADLTDEIAVHAGKAAYCLTQSKIQSVQNNASGKATVTWNKNKKATGYQVSYTTGKTQKIITIKSSTTVSTILKNLKKGSTYSIKVRGYKTVSGVTYYSGWSSGVNVKIIK